jgi:hypothetical protein
MKLVFFPGSTISFPEVLAADALCSVSKLLKDFGVTLVVFLSHVILIQDSVTYHDNGMIVIAFLASLPFM